MKTLIRILIGTVLGASVAAWSQPLTPYAAQYKVVTHGIGVGVANFALAPLDNGLWKFSSKSHTTGFVSLFRSDKINESSIFKVADGKLKAHEYRYQYSGSDDRNQHISFDWDTATAHDSYRGNSKAIEVPTNASDPFLAQLKLSRRVAHGMVKGLFPVVNRKELKTYHLKVTGTGSLSVPAGHYRIVRVERNDPGSSRRTVFWLAPDLHYIPIKVQQFKDGDGVFRLELKSIHFQLLPDPTHQQAR